MIHEELLRRYIALVVECEGTDFLHTPDAAARFSPEELSELHRVASATPAPTKPSPKDVR